MLKFKIFSILICMLSNSWLKVNTFNLSPQPNYVFKEPRLKILMPKVESSYFGYSLNLREDGLMVGAPRAQSDIIEQRDNNQTGAIYKCNFSNNTCTSYYFDKLGNVLQTRYDITSYTYNSFIKNHQWLGAVMDGQKSLMVCAPNIITNVPPNNYLFNGMCYKTPNTQQSQPEYIQKFSSLRSITRQFVVNQYVYMFAQQGFSLHVTEDSKEEEEEYLMGAPGAFDWRGTVLRYTPTRLNRLHGNPNLPVIIYTVEILNSNIWNHPTDAYFGYSVTSGYFHGKTSTKRLYVASSPRANNLAGAVYIFDYIYFHTNIPQEKTIKIYQKFYGQQIGEYFGYTLIAEDFNGDGYTDIVISAPIHSHDKTTYDNGKVYVYLNNGNMIFNEQRSLVSDLITNGRFGTTLGKLGDINRDGFNDLAVSSPFEGDGAVYIFLGSQYGLITKPSQRIAAARSNQFYGRPMFGMGLSRGVDIDGNHFNDLAIGAPNAEVSYVYRSYPVVKILTTIESLTPEIAPTDKKFTLKMCYSYDSAVNISINVELNLSIILDLQYGRAKFESKHQKQELTVKAERSSKCLTLPISLEYSHADIYKPITLELSHDLVKKIPDSPIYCETCVAINPNDRNFIQNRVIFSTGCFNVRCVADLKISSKLMGMKKGSTYILGSTKTIDIEYTIENVGETAFMAQINITIPNTISFFKIPPTCKMVDISMRCDLENGVPLYQNKKVIFNVSIDTFKLEGNELLIKAEALSSGDESNALDNVVEDIIPLMEYSEIEIKGKSSIPTVQLDEVEHDIYNITHSFIIRNLGPSNIKRMVFTIFMPMIYINIKTLEKIQLIEFENILATVGYNNMVLDISWSGVENVITKKNIDNNSTQENIVNLSGEEYDAIKENSNTNNTEQSRRKRFVTNKVNDKTFNDYTQKTLHKHKITRRSVTNQYDINFQNIPLNRTLLFNCENKDEHLCIEANIDVQNFKAGDVPITAELTFGIDLKKIAKLTSNKRDIFVLITASEINKLNDTEGTTMSIVNFNPYTVFTKEIKPSTPMWIYIVSSFIGLLLLILIIFGLYKMGFFRRTKKEDMKKLIREDSVRASMRKERAEQVDDIEPTDDEE